MRLPKFGKNKIQSFVEFDSPKGRVRLGSQGKQIFLELGETKVLLTDASGNVIAPLIPGSILTDLISEATSGAGVTIDGVQFIDSGIKQTANVLQKTVEVTITADEIVGNSAGDVGHVDGAILVAAPTSDYVLQFVSAILIYDYAGAAFGGGADDTVIQIGAVGSQNSVSSAITGANLLEAAGDKVLQLGAIATELVPLVGGALSIAGTALTNPGLSEITTFQLTVAEDTGGIVDVTVGGVTYNIPITADTVDNNAIEIQTYLDAIDGLTATVLTDTVTVTVDDKGLQVDGSFAQGTANSSACTVVVTQQGADLATGVLRAIVTYNLITTNL